MDHNGTGLVVSNDGISGTAAAELPAFGKGSGWRPVYRAVNAAAAEKRVFAALTIVNGNLSYIARRTSSFISQPKPLLPLARRPSGSADTTESAIRIQSGISH